MNTALVFFDRQYTKILKGLSMFLIMLSHATNSFSYGRLFTPLGGIGVAVFLIVSGYGINESEKKTSLDRFWKKRIVKVWMPYVIAILTVSFFSGLVDSFSCCIKSIFFIERPYWFIPYIFECYMIYWVITRFFRRYRYICWAIIIILSIIFLPEIQAEQSFSFFVGVILSEKKDIVHVYLQNTIWIKYFIVLLLIIGLFFLGLKQTPFIRGLQDSICYVLIQILIKGPISFAIIVLPFVLQSFFIQNKITKAIGVISYELYLIHFPLFGLIDNSYLDLIIYTSVSVFGSYLFFKINILYSTKLLNKKKFD